MSEITEGTYPAKLVDWELAEVENVSSPKLVLWFQVTGDGWNQKMKWEQFFLKKDGTQNKKTYDTIKACDFRYNDIADIVDKMDAFNTDKEYTVTIESSEWKDKTYWNVAWVNTTSETRGAIKDKTKLKGHNLGKLNSFLPKSPTVPNHAPQSNDDIDSFLNN